MKSIIMMMAIFSFTLPAIAGSLTADFSFTKRPPFVGLLYLNDNGKTESTNIDQKDKKFLQKLFVNQKSTEAVFDNSDSINHNIFANSPKSGVKFDIGLLPPGANSKIDTASWGDDAVVRIGCKIHPKMKTYVANISSSKQHIIEFEKKKKEYNVVLDAIEGVQPVVLWMPGYDRISVEINPGETKEIELIKKKKVKGTLTLSYQ